MITIDKLERITALRTFVNESELAEAAAELLKRADELEALPRTMDFTRVPEEEAGGYEVTLFCV